MKVWKYSGLFLIITGILHTVVAIVLNWELYFEMIKDGIVNATVDNYPRLFAFWFLVCGIIIIFLGQVLHYYQKREQKPAPLSFGYGMLIFAIIGCVVEPFSGFWLFLPQALIIIIGNKRGSGK